MGQQHKDYRINIWVEHRTQNITNPTKVSYKLATLQNWPSDTKKNFYLSHVIFQRQCIVCWNGCFLSLLFPILLLLSCLQSLYKASPCHLCRSGGGSERTAYCFKMSCGVYTHFNKSEWDSSSQSLSVCASVRLYVRVHACLCVTERARDALSAEINISLAELRGRERQDGESSVMNERGKGLTAVFSVCRGAGGGL